jgi:hypothetical protein
MNHAWWVLASASMLGMHSVWAYQQSPHRLQRWSGSALAAIGLGWWVFHVNRIGFVLGWSLSGTALCLEAARSLATRAPLPPWTAPVDAAAGLAALWLTSGSWLAPSVGYGVGILLAIALGASWTRIAEPTLQELEVVLLGAVGLKLLGSAAFGLRLEQVPLALWAVPWLMAAEVRQRRADAITRLPTARTPPPRR